MQFPLGYLILCSSMHIYVPYIFQYCRHYIISLQCDSPEVNSEMRGRAQQIAERLSFDGFIEASAKNNHKVEWIFEKAVCLVSTLQHTVSCYD